MELVDMGGKMVGLFLSLKKTCFCVIVEQQALGGGKREFRNLMLLPPNTHPYTSHLQTQTFKMQRESQK